MNIQKCNLYFNISMCHYHFLLHKTYPFFFLFIIILLYCTYSYKFVENCKPLILQSNLNYPNMINVCNNVSYNLLYNKITMSNVNKLYN